MTVKNASPCLYGAINNYETVIGLIGGQAFAILSGLVIACALVIYFFCDDKEIAVAIKAHSEANA